MKINIIIYLIFPFILKKCLSSILDKKNKDYIVLSFNNSDFTTFVSINDNKTSTKLTIDLMSFHTMIFEEYISDTGKHMKPIKCLFSYRTFEGDENYLYFTNFKNNSGYFYHVMLKLMTTKLNYLQITPNNTNGILGLARNYTEDVLVSEAFFFGVGKTYSFMDYLLNNNMLHHNIFSIYKDKMILGKPPISSNSIPLIKTCKPLNDLDVTYEQFFWNCGINTLNIFGYNYECSFWDSFVIDTLLIGISLPEHYKKFINPYIQEKSNEKCKIENSHISCDINYKIESLGNFEIIVNQNIRLTFEAKTLFYKNKDQNKYYSYIEFSQFNYVVIVGGKFLIDKYFLTFNNDENYIGFGLLNKVQLDLDSYPLFILIVINIILIFFNSILLLFSKYFLFEKLL